MPDALAIDLSVRCLIELTPISDPLGRHHLAAIFLPIGESIADALPPGEWTNVVLSGQLIPRDEWATT